MLLSPFHLYLLVHDAPEMLCDLPLVLLESTDLPLVALNLLVGFDVSTELIVEFGCQFLEFLLECSIGLGFGAEEVGVDLSGFEVVALILFMKDMIEFILMESEFLQLQFMLQYLLPCPL